MVCLGAKVPKTSWEYGHRPTRLASVHPNPGPAVDESQRGKSCGRMGWGPWGVGRVCLPV